MLWKQVRAVSLIFVWCILLMPSQALAQSALVAVEVEIQFRSRTISRTLYCRDKTPGTVNTKKNSIRFIPLSKRLKNLRRKGKRSALKIWRLLNREGRLQCSDSGGGSTPQPTPTPEAYFTESGAVTTSGKVAFGIPAELDANLTDGKDVYDTKCFGCHNERTNRTFSNLRLSTEKSPMFYTTLTLPDDELADLTAYLNRFQIPQ